MFAAAYQGLLVCKESVPFEYRRYLGRAAQLAKITKKMDDVRFWRATAFG
jgi:hypothetical protein